MRKFLPFSRINKVTENDPGIKILEKYRCQVKKSEFKEKDYICLRDLKLVVLDTETTGLKPQAGDEIISVGACFIKSGELMPECIHRLVNPLRPIPRLITDLTGIDDQMAAGAEGFCQVVADLLEFIGDSVIIGHSIDFDINFLNFKLKPYNVRINNHVIDTGILSKALNPQLKLHSLDSILSYLDIYPEGRHTSLGDALLTANVFLSFQKQLEELRIKTLHDLKCYIRNAMLYKF